MNLLMTSALSMVETVVYLDRTELSHSSEQVGASLLLIFVLFNLHCLGKYVAQLLDEYMFTLVNMLDHSGGL